MFGIILGWVLFIFIAYKTSQVELDFKDFDPYAELEIDRVCVYSMTNHIISKT